MTGQTRNTIDWANPLSWFTTAKAVVRGRYDLVIIVWWTWFWFPSYLVITLFLNRAKDTRKKILFLCHNIFDHEASGWQKMISRVVLSKGNLFLVHSRREENKLKKWFPTATIKAVSLPELGIFNKSDISQKQARKKLGLKGRNILFFGHIRPYKGLEYLLRAMPLILEEIDLALVIAGEFWKGRRRYLKTIKDLGIANHVKLVDGYVPNEEVGKYFNACDLVVMPYVSATATGITRLAFAFGKPVVATSVGDLPEIVAGKKRGVLVPPKRPDMLAKAIIDCYRQNKIPIYEANIRKWGRKSDWKSLVKTIDNFL